MATIRIKMAMDNDAFDQNEGREAARVLRELADRLEEDGAWTGAEGLLRDVNGNRVGEWAVRL